MKALTVQMLRDGRVAYLGPGGEWRPSLKDAALLTEADAEAALSAARARATEIADAYLIDVAEDNGAARGPIGRSRLREQVRASGPTIKAGPARRPTRDHGAR